MDEYQLKKEIQALEREIAILQWDKKRNQLNPGKEVYLNKIIEKKEKLVTGEQPQELEIVQ